MLLATLCFSLLQALIKSLTELHTFEIFFFRGLSSSILCFLYLRWYHIPILGISKQYKWLLGRAFTGIFATCVFYFTLKWMPFGAAVSLKYLSPIFAASIAILILKEKVNWAQWFCFSLALAGVALLKGFDNRIDTLSLALAFLAAIIGGLAFIFIRKIGKSEHPVVIVNYYMFLSALLMGVLSIPVWRLPTWEEGACLTLIGISGFLGQLFMTRAMQTEAVNRVAPMKYLELIYALLVGLFWFGENYTFWSFIGILLIFTGMLLNIRVSTKNSSPTMLLGKRK